MIQSILGRGTSGKTFTSADIKRVYFGNWLRDYCESGSARRGSGCDNRNSPGHGHCRTPEDDQGNHNHGSICTFFSLLRIRHRVCAPSLLSRVPEAEIGNMN